MRVVVARGVETIALAPVFHEVFGVEPGGLASAG
jgi:hypothetical protein